MMELDQGDYTRAHTLFEESLAIRRDLGNKKDIAESLNALAALAAGQGQPVRAARLWAAAAALREAAGYLLPPREQEDYDRRREAARAACSEEESAAAREHGQAMTIEQAIAYALEPEPTPSPR
jgi:hypothetical protein